MERLVEGATGAVSVAPDDSSHQRGQRADADPDRAAGTQPLFAAQEEASGGQVDDDGRDPRCAAQSHIHSQMGCDAILSTGSTPVHIIVVRRHFLRSSPSHGGDRGTIPKEAEHGVKGKILIYVIERLSSTGAFRGPAFQRGSPRPNAPPNQSALSLMRQASHPCSLTHVFGSLSTGFTPVT